MKIIVKQIPLRHIVRWTQRSLFTVGLLLLGYCAFVVSDAWIFQALASHKLERQRQDESPAFRVALTSGSPTPARTEIGPDGLIGRLSIPRLGLSVVVFEGIGSKTLRHAAGHVETTALPGQQGNVGIAAHRDTYFRPLKDIREDDIVTMTTPAGDYNYRVTWTKVVSPYDVDVLNSTGDDVLTLVTCYPFYFVGPAPHRFIVRAERVL